MLRFHERFLAATQGFGRIYRARMALDSAFFSIWANDSGVGSREVHGAMMVGEGQ